MLLQLTPSKQVVLFLSIGQIYSQIHTQWFYPIPMAWDRDRYCPPADGMSPFENPKGRFPG